jgi:hypothetical protein
LYHLEHTFEDRDLEILFGEALTAGDFKDDTV